MLILTRKPGESLYIGDNVKVTIVEIKGHQIRVGIEAPKELRIYREEIYLQILEENRKAALSDEVDLGLESLSKAWEGTPERVTKERSLQGVSALRTAGVKKSSPEGNESNSSPPPVKDRQEGGAAPKVVMKRKRSKSTNES